MDGERYTLGASIDTQCDLVNDAHVAGRSAAEGLMLCWMHHAAKVWQNNATERIGRGHIVSDAGGHDGTARRAMRTAPRLTDGRGHSDADDKLSAKVRHRLFNSVLVFLLNCYHIALNTLKLHSSRRYNVNRHKNAFYTR